MTKEMWNKFLVGAHQPGSLTSQTPIMRIEAEYFVTWATRGFDQTKQLLIVGCGDGYEILMARKLGFQEVLGVSFYADEIENAQRQGLHLEKDIWKADLHALPFTNDRFDYVISKETLEHLLCPYIGLYEINRVMKQDGKFCHLTPGGINKQADWYHYHCAPDWMWTDLMLKTGFEVEQVGNVLQQNYYKGYKKSTKDLSKPYEMVNLVDYMAKIRRYDTSF